MITSVTLNQSIPVIFTDEDERYSDEEGQDVSSDWLVVFPVTFGKELERLVDVVLAQSLWTDSLLRASLQSTAVFYCILRLSYKRL